MKAYDLVIIGTGPGGFMAALGAANIGKKVACVEKEQIGGCCLNWGCMPTKGLIHSAEHIENIKTGVSGVKVENVSLNYDEILANTNQSLHKLRQGLTFRLKSKGVDIFEGTGKILSSKHVQVQQKDGLLDLQTEKVLIATGNQPKTLADINIPCSKDVSEIINAKNFLEHKKLPKSITIIGGGAIGIEFAYILHSFGVEINLIETRSHILPMEDLEIISAMEKILAQKGIKIHLNLSLKRISSSKNGVSVAFEQNNENKILESERIFLAIGTKPNTNGLFAENLDIKKDARGFISVDSNFETSEKNIFAVGDITGINLLAHSAMYNAMCFVEKTFSKDIQAITDQSMAEFASVFCTNSERGSSIVPHCLYLQPQIASVGLTEEQVKEKNIPYKISKLPFAHVGKSVVCNETEGFIKIIAHSKTGKILGTHIIGRNVSNIISEITLAINAQATIKDLINTMHSHPSISESIGECAQNFF